MRMSNNQMSIIEENLYKAYSDSREMLENEIYLISSDNINKIIIASIDYADFKIRLRDQEDIVSIIGKNTGANAPETLLSKAYFIDRNGHVGTIYNFRRILQKYMPLFPVYENERSFIFEYLFYRLLVPYSSFKTLKVNKINFQLLDLDSGKSQDIWFPFFDFGDKLRFNNDLDLIKNRELGVIKYSLSSKEKRIFSDVWETIEAINCAMLLLHVPYNVRIINLSVEIEGQEYPFLSINESSVSQGYVFISSEVNHTNLINLVNKIKTEEKFKNSILKVHNLDILPDEFRLMVLIGIFEYIYKAKNTPIKLKVYEQHLRKTKNSRCPACGISDENFKGRAKSLAVVKSLNSRYTIESFVNLINYSYYFRNKVAHHDSPLNLEELEIISILSKVMERNFVLYLHKEIGIKYSSKDAYKPHLDEYKRAISYLKKLPLI